jgi:hypothetical protein
MAVAGSWEPQGRGEHPRRIGLLSQRVTKPYCRSDLFDDGRIKLHSRVLHTLMRYSQEKGAI